MERLSPGQRMCKNLIVHTLSQNPQPISLKDVPLWSDIGEYNRLTMPTSIVERGLKISIDDGVAMAEEAALFTMRLRESTTSTPSLDVCPLIDGPFIRKRAIFNKEQGEKLFSYSGEELETDVPSNRLSGCHIFHEDSPIAVSLSQCYVKANDLLLVGNDKKITNKEGAPSFWFPNETLTQYMLSSGAIFEENIIYDHEPSNICSPWHAEFLKGKAEESFVEYVRTQMRSRASSWTVALASEAEKALGRYIKLEQGLQEATKHIILSAQSIISKEKEALVDSVYRGIYGSDGVPETTSEKITGIEQYTIDGKRRRPKIMLRGNVRSISVLAAWLDPDYAKWKDDGAIKLIFPFKMLDEAVCKLAVQYVASRMIYTETPVELYYAGCAKGW